MKKSKFSKLSTLTKINKNTVVGGATGSDVTFTDSKRDGGGYDIAVNSLIDIKTSSETLDKPA